MVELFEIAKVNSYELSRTAMEMAGMYLQK